MDISASELKKRYQDARPVNVIDVREELEFHSFNIGGANIPLGKLSRCLDDLDFDQDDELIVICQHGLRSKTAMQLLQAYGFSNVKNLTGGLLAWRKANL